MNAHQESQLRQYALGERAREIGWPAERIRTIDADLGESASEKARGERGGFREMCDLIARDHVGGIFGIEVSRLARNTMEWFQLLDLCRRHDTVLVEDCHIYCPSRDDDSLVLGIKGTVSAAELSFIRARMEGGKRNKALRGELYSRVPIGFVRDGSTLRKDPDARVQAAIATVFARFRQAGSARQATMLLREAGEDVPSRRHPGAALEWGPARYERVYRILTNPAMGGAYAYGFKRGVGHGAPLRPVQERWDILQPEKHEGYVSWAEWLEVQEQLARNHMAPDGARGAAREGSALLQGLAVCGGCGLPMTVYYSKTGWGYECRKRDAARRRGGCWSTGGKRVDAEVARLFLDAVTPAGVEAARQAACDVAERGLRALRRWELDLEHCRYEARLAERRYKQVDPDNRLIAATLEREWEKALRAEKAAQEALEAARARQPAAPAPAVFEGLGARLSQVWGASSTTMRERKRLLACLLDEVTIELARQEREIMATLRWRGGQIDEITLPMLAGSPTPRRDERSTVELVRKLSCFYNDRETAKVLTRQGRRTARGLDFTAELVGSLRRRHGIAPYQPDGDEPVLMGVADVAKEIGVSDDTIYRWIREGLVPVAQPDIEGAPLRIRMTPTLRERFREAPPEGFVPLAVAMDRLGVTRQTVWERIKAGRLDSCHVTRGKTRGLYVRLPVEDELPLLRGLNGDGG